VSAALSQSLQEQELDSVYVGSMSLLAKHVFWFLSSTAMDPSTKNDLQSSPHSVQLHWRLPNPPTFFVGRDNERSQLLRMIARSPITLVTGPGGTGKSALVASVLSDGLTEYKIVRVGMRPSDSLAQLCVTMLKAAFEVTDRSAQDWSNAAQSMRLLVSAVLDVAEGHQLLFVLEDLHNGDEEEVDSFLLLLHQYASRSRWVVTMRRRAKLSAMAEQQLALPPLSTPVLAELAHLCTPGRNQEENIVIAEQAEGSPWRLRQLLSETPLALNPSGSVSRDDLSASSGLLRALSVLELPLPADVLGQFAEIPSPSRLGQLVQEGMLEPGSDRLRLHDRARQHISAGTADTETKALKLRVVRGLKDDHRSVSRLEAIRLALSVDIDEAAQLLSVHINDLIARGHAPRIWEMLGAINEATFDPCRFRLAIHLAGGEPMQWALSRPEPEDVEDRLSWIGIQYLGGRVGTALEAASKLRGELDVKDSPEQALVCSLTCYRALMQLGRTQDACRVLRQIDVSDPLIMLQRDAALARALIVSGGFTEGLKLAQRVWADWPERADAVEPETCGEIASAFILLGRLRDAADVLGNGEYIRPVHSVGGRLRQLFLDVRRGDIENAKRWIQSLDDGPKTASVLSVFVRTQQAVLGIAMGDLRSAETTVDAALKEAEKSGNGYMYQWARFTRLTLAWHRGEPLQTHPIPIDIAAPVGPQATALRAFERAQAIRFGDKYIDSPPDTLVLEAHVIDLIASAEALLIGGDVAGARRRAQSAHRLCVEHELGLIQADVLRALCDIEFIAGDMIRLRGHAESLGERLPGSLHYGPLADFYGAVASAEGLTGLALWRWAQLWHESPLLAGRCAAFLGMDTASDNRLRCTILAQMASRLGQALVFHPERSQAWGLDVSQRRVWIGDRGVMFGRRTIALKLLEFMALNGGQATKRELAEAVWEIAEYHPFHDDKRIQVTIRRLRQQLADEPTPELLITTESGYAFGSTRAFLFMGNIPVQ